MGKKIASIELYSPGIVIFDPLVLDDFLKKNNVSETDIFTCLLNDELLGRSAIEQGVLIPIYEIPEEKYSVFIEEHAIDSEPKAKFKYDGFPFQVRSEVVIVSDLNALFDWDPEFFKNYETLYGKKLPNSDFINVPNGFYSVAISGYVGLKFPSGSNGYGVRFVSVEKLPRVDKDAEVDDCNFVI